MTEHKTNFFGRRIGVNEQLRKEARNQKIKSGISRSCRWFARRGWIICVVVAALCVAAYQQRFELQRFNPLEFRHLQYVDIEGNRMLSWEDVVQNAQIETGMLMGDVDEDSVRQALLRLPLIHDATVTKSFPSTLNIKLTETSPVFSVFDGTSVVGFSEKGLPMSIARASAMRLPIFDNENMDKVKDVAAFLTTMRQMDSDLYEKVSQVSWSEKDKAFEVFFKDAGYHVLFAADRWTEDVFALYESLGKGFSKDLRCAGEVDMRFPGFAYVRNYEKRCLNG